MNLFDKMLLEGYEYWFDVGENVVVEDEVMVMVFEEVLDVEVFLEVFVFIVFFFLVYNSFVFRLVCILVKEIVYRWL